MMTLLRVVPDFRKCAHRDEGWCAKCVAELWDHKIHLEHSCGIWKELYDSCEEMLDEAKKGKIPEFFR